MAGEKTEKASPKKKEDERKKGNIFQSNDLILAAGLIVIYIVFRALSPAFISLLEKMYVSYFADTAVTMDDMTISNAGILFRDALLKFAIVALPLMFAAMLGGILLTGIQTRFKFTASYIKPKFERINPIKGFAKLFSLRSLVELLKAIIKVAIIISIFYIQIKPTLSEFPKMFFSDISESFQWTSNIISSLFISIIIALTAFAVLDYLYQWWEYEKNIRMTKQEVKEEYKQMEGDPQIKSKIREVQRKISLSRMMQKIPQADVVITNPTHFAVCIRYDHEKDNAPVVIAKGQDYLALRIIEEAKKCGIERVENRPLARGLYASTEIDQEIPAEFFQAVAEVLAYVYTLKKKGLKKR